MPDGQNPNLLRDHLANERTFLSWMRTAITVVALGFVVARFGVLLREVSGGHARSGSARVGAIVGVALVFGGMVTAGLGALKFTQTKRDIDRNLVHFSMTIDLALAGVLGLASIVLAVYLITTA